MFKNKKMCRTCLTSERELIPISATVEADKRIVDYFRNYLSFPIAEDDKLPQSICPNCLDSVLEVKKFYLQCKDAEAYLNKKLLNSMEDIEDKSILDDKPKVVIIEKFAQEPSCEDSHSSESEDIIEYSPVETVFLEDTDRQFEGSNATTAEENKEKEEQYPCIRSGRSFRMKRNYENHMKRQKSNTKRKCPQCNKTFFSEVRMRKHFRTVHVKPNNDESCLCPLCGLQLSSRRNFNAHMRTHNENRKKYECEFCDKSFFRKDSIIFHLRTHTGERPFECEICHKRFTQKNILDTHMTLHTGKTVKCPLCDKTFSRPSFLKIHNREHTDERPYACDMCPKRYRQMAHLRDHQVIHYNLKPFSCNICGKSYTHKSTLSQHLFVHNGKPFKCPACAMKFIRPLRFRQHLINSHSIYDDPQKYKIDVNNPGSDNKDMLDENFVTDEFEDNNDEISDESNREDVEIHITNL